MIKRSLVALYILSPMVVVAAYFHQNWYSFFHSWSLATFAGIFAFCYFLNQFITGPRFKVLDRTYGYERVIAFHRIMATVALMFAIAHSRLRHGQPEDLQVMLGEIALMLFVLLSVLAVVLLTSAPGHVPPIRWVRNFLQRRLRIGYQHFRGIHNITAVAMLLALLHVLLAASTQENWLRTGLMSAWFAGAMGAYLWRKFIYPLWLGRRPFVIRKIDTLAPRVVTLHLHRDPASIRRQPRRSYADHPGTYCFIKVLTGAARGDEHPFTLCKCGESDIAVTIKDSGDWSKRIQTQAAVGDAVRVDGPYGHFSHTFLSGQARERTLVFIGGGIGVTPFMAMLDGLAAEKSKRKIIFIWKTRADEKHILDAYLPGWQAGLANLEVHVAVSQAPSNTGQREPAGKLLEYAAPDILRAGEIYICGPTKMQRTLRADLQGMGVPRQQLHYEDFGF